MPNNQYQPANLLWGAYDPAHAPHAFNATNPPDALHWQSRTRQAFGKALGLHRLAAAPLEVSTIQVVDKGDYERHKLLLRTTPHSIMPFYLLLPKHRPQPLAAVVAFHGHGYGVADIVGLWEDGTERNTPSGYHKDFAVMLCRAGFAVAAPEISCFGERQNDYSYLDTINGQPVPSTCHHTSMLALHLGLSVAGIRVHDGIKLIDYLQSQSDIIDSNRIGAMGISGGGMHTLFSAAIDERIKASVISGYFSTFKDSILAMHHCSCNFVPGLGQFGEMADIAGLMAPRPFLVEAATHDPIFPIAAVKRGVQQARSVYAQFEASQQIETDIFEGRHEINGPAAVAFLRRHL